MAEEGECAGVNGNARERSGVEQSLDGRGEEGERGSRGCEKGGEGEGLHCMVKERKRGDG